MPRIKPIIEERAAKLERELASVEGVLLDQGYIVVVQGNAITFDADNQCRTASTPGVATRFTQEDAQRIGASITNGNGKHGEAMHVRHAIMHDLAICRRLLKND